ncbi:MAG TPA: 4,5-DOPA dioxygenase extradiol [Sediminibacterium sp.]|uniref:4,5-DOPA-extradiol-dioxygenase n=1 Tax=Sediminibacterium sp. TaxID=1917865 RepID=UPI0008B09196|nr:4,5-DOPA dioxygenase extradiol [Sediminibacterium sp.]OHC84685.1 MAG: 4,5-DOPA dioxygenase extradiol [Sphingobacteriia bacterium RIFOXYC2_FULL_35_18]OHC88177.1 MAG: 4,5-DOPA dioxygenase extradiol [Sphingobacteriia bacterium RIFOXYD2_FULL_35_12]HLD53220.1 4,5-DOPA dioxygenase extradiol [Sediminibacterium sp.]
MTTLSSFKNFTDTLKEQEQLMPVLFIGHGSPMNGIEDTIFSRNWTQMAKDIPTPNAVLVVSAHWLSRGTKITAMDFPKTIHDFGGFPPELFAVQYPAPGNPILAKETAGLIHSTQVELDHDWGLDHGTWTVVRHMYPDANIPVLQLSIDYTKAPQWHYDLAKEIHALRKKGVLIIGSGNMVHNLRMVAWDKLNEPEYGYDWALTMNEKFKQLISSRDYTSLINYESLGTAAKLAIPTSEHYLPLLYTLGLSDSKDTISFFNDKAVGGSLTMTSVKIG